MLSKTLTKDDIKSLQKIAKKGLLCREEINWCLDRCPISQERFDKMSFIRENGLPYKVIDEDICSLILEWSLRRRSSVLDRHDQALI